MSSELEQIDKAKNGCIKSRNEIILSYYKMCFKIAYRYPCVFLTVEDLADEGVSGIIKAIEKFDFSKNKKFSSYVGYQIESAIKEAVRKSGLVRRAGGRALYATQAALAWAPIEGLDNQAPGVVGSPSTPTVEEICLLVPKYIDQKSSKRGPKPKISDKELLKLALTSNKNGEYPGVVEIAKIIGVSHQAINQRMNVIYNIIRETFVETI